MRRIIISLLLAGLVLGFCACEKAEPMPGITQTTAQTTAKPEPAKLPEGYSFAVSYAKTPTHFYAVKENTLYKVLLADITQYETVPLPETDAGRPVNICGVSPACLYIYRGDAWSAGAVYRLPFDGDEADVMLEGPDIKAPWYHVAGNSLLYFCDVSSPRIEALHLDTGETSVVFDQPGFLNFDIWYNAEDGCSVLRINNDEYSFLCVDENNQIDLDRHDIEYLYDSAGEPELSKEAKAVLAQEGNITTYATCGGWLYYVEGRYTNGLNFYRMRSDGTEKTLLRAKTHIMQLAAVEDKLVALAYYERTYDMGEQMLHLLDADGKVLETIMKDEENENYGISMQQMDSLIRIDADAYGGGHWIGFHTLYDPITGAVFS